MKAYGKEIDDAVSIGLGAGDNRQAAVVAEIAKHYPGSHINQVFPFSWSDTCKSWRKR